MGIIEYLKFLFHSVFVRKQIQTQESDSVFSVDYGVLKKKGARLLIFDVDDTLTWHRGRLEEKTLRLLRKLSKNFRISVFSNCEDRRRRQVAQMLSGLDLYIAPMGGKPGKDGFIHIMEHFKIKPEGTVMIGDRMGTDIWGAYAVGIRFRILVGDYKTKTGKTPFIIRFFKNIERSLQ
jgi:HAD superfamily phosphatase (TIGR01668 family)